MSTPYANLLLWIKAKKATKLRPKPKALPHKVIQKAPASSHKPSESLSEFCSSLVTDDFYNNKRILLSYVSSTHFALKTVNFRAPKDIKMLLRGSIYNYDQKCWLLSHEKYQEVLKGLNIVCDDLDILVQAIPDFVFKAVSPAKAFFGYDYSSDLAIAPPFHEKLPSTIKTQLLPFQVKGIEFAVKHDGRIIIGDETGTGKKLQAMTIAYLYKDEWPVLVLTHPVLVSSWVQEIAKWLPETLIEVLTSKSFPVKCSKATQLYVAGYDFSKPLGLTMQKLSPKVVIADEAHLLKSIAGKRLRVLTCLFARCRRLVLLTGAESVFTQPNEVYFLIRYVRPDLFEKSQEYKTRYCDSTGHPESALLMEELMHILNSTVLIKRTKEEMLQELPEKQRVIVNIEANEIKAKIKGILAFIWTLIHKWVKTVIFAWNMKIMNEIEDFLKANKADYVRIDLNTPYIQRHDLIAKFQTETACRIALCSLEVAHTVCLSSASTVVFAELHWNHQLISQAEKSVTNPENSKSITVYLIVLDKTLDKSHLLKIPEESTGAALHKPTSIVLPRKVPGGFQFVLKKKASAAEECPGPENGFKQMFITFNENEQNEILKLISSDKDPFPEEFKHATRETSDEFWEPPSKMKPFDNI